MQSSVTIAIALICLTSTANAGDLITRDDVVTLCSTATPEPVSSLLTQSPLDASRERHAYTIRRMDQVVDVHSVRMASAHFMTLPAEAGFFVIDTTEPLPALQGDVRLDLGPSTALAFSATPAEIEWLSTSHSEGLLELELYFRLASLDDTECTYCRSDEDGTITVDARLLSARLVDPQSKGVVAEVTTDRLFGPRVARDELGRPTRTSAPPRVEVVNATVLETPQSPDEVEYITLEAESALLECYVRGLEQNGGLRGAFVSVLSVTREGLISGPTLSIDAIGDAMLTACSRASLEAIAIPRRQPEPPYRVRLTVVFAAE